MRKAKGSHYIIIIIIIVVVVVAIVLYVCYLFYLIAQMDCTKSLGYRAVEELLRAQTTQSRLKRQFMMSSLKEESEKKREQFFKEEVINIVTIKYIIFTCITMDRLRHVKNLKEY